MMKSDANLSLYTIYKNPTDYPGKFVVRRWSVGNKDGVPTPDKEPTIVTDDLEKARGVIPFGYNMFLRNEDDDPKIVETWL